MNYSAINIQGNIISGEILEKIRIEDIRYQHAKDFSLDPGTSLREEISLAWSLAVSHWNAFKQKREKLSDTDTGTTDTRNYWMKPLMGILGYDLSTATAEDLHGKSYAISFRATNSHDLPVHFVGINQSLDARANSGGPRLSPHALIQEYLNNQDQHLYGLVSNGKFLRLLRDATKLSRLSYVEFNLEQVMEEGLFAEFALLYRLLHVSRMAAEKAGGKESIIEFYHQEALASGSRIRERLSLAVETSIKELANGFLLHDGNDALRETIVANRLTPNEYYLYNLRIIYRLLFLMVIEERKLIYPVERTEEQDNQQMIYYQYYSIRRISKLAERAIYVDPKKTDLWQSIITCFMLFQYGKYGKALGIDPLGSGLFAPDALGLMEEQLLDNQTVLKVIGNLVMFYNENERQVRVNYADLDVEEFGSVYEGLLEYEPVFQNANTEPVFLFKQGNERSKSGSHYTPEELVKPLIQHSLDYLIADKLKEKDPEAGLLSLKVCDVACGSGHILLSAARRIGLELAKLRSKEDQPSPPVLRHAIRDVINHCIYGVDKNPLAVELCKVAMWLEAHNPGHPLNFLDHHIKCGDAVVGLAHRDELEKGIANEAFKFLHGDDKAVASSFARKNKEEKKRLVSTGAGQQLTTEEQIDNCVAETNTEYKTFIKLPEKTPEEIEQKAKAYRKFLEGKGYGFLKAMADTQVAQFFITKTDANKDYLLTDADYQLILKGYKGWKDMRTAKAAAVAEEERFFHWFLEFPEVFSKGGFECVIGNPPFLGGSKISVIIGKSHLNYLHFLFKPAGGLCDLVAYFFRRAFSVLANSGIQSLIATNSISQGDTREGGLDIITSEGGEINYGIKSMKWPGLAAVEVSLVSIIKGTRKADKILNGVNVEYISTFLDDSKVDLPPSPLISNSNKCFNGSKIYGNGFLVKEQYALNLIQEAPRYKKVLFPYLIGDDLNDDFYQKSGRWVINFFNFPLRRYEPREWMALTKEERVEINERIGVGKFVPIAPPDYELDVAMDYPICFELVLQYVKPERDKVNRDTRKARWWIYGERAPGLYSSLVGQQGCFVTALTGKYLAFTNYETDIIFSHATGVIADNSYHHFSLVQNTFHEFWAWKYCSSMGISLRYTPASAYEIYPFPVDLNRKVIENLSTCGQAYHDKRKKLLATLALGLTKLYNAFHAPEVKLGISAAAFSSIDKTTIEKTYGKEVCNLWNHLQKTKGTCSIEEAVASVVELRQLHVQMDNAVLDAYGWSDVRLRHDFYEVEYLPENDRVRFTINHDARKELLKRLLELNHKIHEEEVKAGLWDKKEKKYKATEESGSAVEEGEVNYGLFNQK